MRKIHNKLVQKRIYLLLALFSIMINTTSCLTEYYTPSSTASYTGTTAYCQGAVATPNTLNYNQCTPGGGLATSGVTCTGQWYYNTTGSTSIALSTPLGSAFSFTTPGGSTATTGTLVYTPLTTTVGTFYYFLYSTWSAGSTCASPFTSTTQSVVISPTIGTITGASSMCVGSTSTVSTSATGGTWVSGSPGVATVVSTTGVVTGVAIGTAIISYTTGVGCPATAVVTVTPTPPTFSITPGSASFCVGSQLLTAPAVAATSTNVVFAAGGAFGVPDNSPAGVTNNITVSGIPALATVADMFVRLNNVAMTYDGDLVFNIKSPGGSILNLVNQEGGAGDDFTNTNISSLGGPTLGSSASPFTGTFAADAIIGAGPSGSPSTVNSWTSLLSNPNGVWTLGVRDMASGDVATVNNWTIHIHYTTPAINYTWAPTAGLYTDAALTIPYTGTITNSVYASPTATTTYTATAVYAGYTCQRTATSTITIAGAYAPITGTATVCVGATTTLADATTGGNWSTSSPLISVGATTGIVTGISAGTAIVSYGTGLCASTRIVTVNPNPAAIAGVFSVCAGSTITLTNTTTGGTWTSSNTGVANIGASNGVVTTVATTGTTTITYQLSTSCYVTAVVSVNPLPATITGPTNVCIGATITLANTSTGGTWTSSNPAMGTIGASNGVVGGIAAGTVTITYTTTGGCYVTTPVTVNTAPGAITGTLYACAGQTTTLSDAPTGGTWTSVTTGVGTIDAVTGVLTGVSGGTTTISYSLGAGCVATAVATVNPAPAAITGNVPVCVGSSITVADATGTGTWSLTGAGGIIGAGTGILTGTGSGGNPTITYTIPAVAPASAGCYITAIATVNPLPAPITGTLAICQGTASTLSSATAGVTWSSSAPSIANIDVTTGVVTGLTAGTATITEMTTAGCTRSVVVTVNPLPAVITGGLSVCVGATSTLASATTGGTWSSSTPGIASIGASNGVVTGAFAGNAVITYALTATGCYTVAIVTVNPNTAPIGGSLNVCVGGTTTLSASVTGGTWTSSNANATVGLSTGIVTGVTAGTSTITGYTPLGCPSSVVVSVNAIPAAIGGPTAVCVGSNITVTTATTGVTWSSSDATIASITPATGVVTGVAAGTVTITTTSAAGCINTTTITVNPLPAAITGSQTVCIGYTTTLADATAGGTWSGIAPATGNVTVGAANGVVTGIAAGTVTITYTAPLTGCKTTAIVTVNALPGAITGVLSTCVSASTTLSNSATGGTWSSLDPATASAAATTGVVTGVAGGTTTITYTIGSGCYVTAVYTVNPLPAPISGVTVVCVGSTTALSTTTPGATWSSSNTAIATVGASTGVVSGVAAGTSIITCYTPLGCNISTVVTVNPLPATISGVLTVCPGTTTTLADATTGGAWSTASANVSVDPVTGVVTGITAGTATITYTLSATGCLRVVTVTVNPLPAAITGTTFNVCAGSSILLSDATPGGTWSSSTVAVATIGSSTGIVTALPGTGGTTTITYKLSATGCYNTAIVTVNPLPSAIGGTLTVCPLTTTTLTDATAGGTWTTASGNISINASSGEVTGIAAGTARVTYTLGTGCIITAIVTVNPLPATIGGTLTVCPGTTTTLTNTSTGGTWASSATSVATIGASNGVAAGVAAGNATITYTLSTGCLKTAELTVNPLPAAIAGGLAVCSGLTTALTDATPGGTWSSSNTSVASIGSSTGVVTGGGVGNATISYILSATGCYMTAIVTVNGLPPAIGGVLTVCPGTTTTVTDGATGGVWSIGAPGTGGATIDPSTGIISGVTAGTMTITYTVGTGCITTAVLTINPLPAAISGSLAVCFGLSSSLADATTGGTWSSSAPGIASINSSTGVMTGNAVGNATITYKLTTTGCYITDVATVNPLPGAITGSAGFCNYTTTTLSDVTPGGTWSSTNTSVATINATIGAITGIMVDTVTIIYTLPTGCITSRLETVILAPFPVTGPNTVCEGSTVTLGNAIAGGTWTSGTPSVASVGYYSGEVAGNSNGTTLIVYELSTGCFSTLIMTVDLTPAPITGPFTVCYGLTTTVGESTPGGVWSSTDATVAPISTGGVVSGANAGTTIISYTMPTGCNATAALTVNPLPAPITGVFEFCLGLTTTLSDASTGGTWSSGNTSVAMTIPATGVVAGVGVGTAPITYTLPTGCIITQDVTVDPLPAPITGIFQVCIGLSVTLNDATGTGTWSSSDPSVASIDAGGVVTGMSAGLTTITYMLSTGCVSTVEVTVNALPPAIGGNLMVCAGFTSNLNDASPGGTWNTDAAAAGIGSIHPTTGVVTGIAPGTMNITYTLPSGCQVTTVVTVNVLPSPVMGNFAVCEGATTSLSDPDAGGTWSTSNPAVGTVDLITGVVSGITAGVTEITYTFITTGCINKAIVTVNPIPAPITGTDSVCEGSTITLHDITMPGAGGWSSSNMSVAYFAAPFDGVLTGASAGTTVVTYRLPYTGCYVNKIVTVNPLPAVIAGPNGICLGSTVTLTDATTGGTWTSFNPASAPITSAGVVSGVSLGTTIITYALATGCLRTKPMTVNALPAVHTVSGSAAFCAGSNGAHIYLDGSDIGISYLLYYGASATGYVAGTGGPLDFGLHTVAGVYTVLATNAITGCTRNMAGSAVLTVNPLVVPTVAIHTNSGTDTVCPGAATIFSTTNTYSGTTPSYVWKVNGTTVGTSSTYNYLPADGDLVTVRMTSSYNCATPVTANDSMRVKVLPAAIPVASIDITPGDTVCDFTPTSFAASASFGGWSPVYKWFVNSSLVGTGPLFSYVPLDGDVVSVRLISNYQCRLADSVMSTNATMSVQPMLIPHVDIVTYPGLSVAPGQRDSLATVVSNAGSHPAYQWHVNSIPIPGATNSYYVDTFQDYDSVACIVTSSDVCHGISSFDWVFITIHPTGVTPTATAISDIRLMPNPNKGTFSVKGTLGTSVDEDMIMEVTDMLGQVVYKRAIVARQGRVDEQVQLDKALANGMYLLNLKSGNQNKVFHFVMEE